MKPFMEGCIYLPLDDLNFISLASWSQFELSDFGQSSYHKEPFETAYSWKSIIPIIAEGIKSKNKVISCILKFSYESGC